MRDTVTKILWLTPVLACTLAIAGCDQKAKPVQAQPQALAPPIVDTPPPKPATVSTADLPPPVVGPPPAAPTNTETATKPAEPPKKQPRHPKTPATTTPATTAAPAATPQPTQEAAATPPAPSASVSAIGELSGGASGDQRSQTEATINATEKGLNAITRTLSESETKTAAQIREFLKQARVALTSGDVDGAVTLTKKARVLLAELNQ